MQGPGFVPLSVIDGDKQPEDVYAEEEARRSVTPYHELVSHAH